MISTFRAEGKCVGFERFLVDSTGKEQKELKERERNREENGGQNFMTTDSQTYILSCNPPPFTSPVHLSHRDGPPEKRYWYLVLVAGRT